MNTQTKYETPYTHTEQSTEKLRERQEELHDLLDFVKEPSRLSNLRHELGCVALELRMRGVEV